ncbi:MAG TPA: hypothetical protein VF933_24830, partial [Streptosporangiaceae bacterium]
MTTSPGPLAQPDRLAVFDQVHQLADQDLNGPLRVVAEARGHRLHPADIAVVVRAEHDHHPVEPPGPLVQVVGAVRSEVRPAAVALDQHPVLVVAEVGGPQPDGAVALVDVALLAQPCQGGVQLAPVVQLLLVE